MQPPAGRLFTFVAFLFVLLFTATVFAVAIQNADTVDIHTIPVRGDVEEPGNLNDLNDGGSVKERQVDSVGNHCGFMEGGFELFPCNSASSLHLPFRNVFKLPVLLINSLAFATNKVHGAAVSPLLPSQVKRSTFESNNPNHSKDLNVQERQACGVEDGDGFMQFPCGSASGLKVPSIFTIPIILFNTIRSIPGAVAAATPINNKRERSEAENLSPSVELNRLSRSIAPSLSDMRSLFPNEKRKAAMNLTERDYPPYCNCNENSCFDSPPCCANGSCPANAASGVKVPSILTIPVILINAISSIPRAMMAAIPSASESLEERKFDWCLCPLGESSCTLADCCATGTCELRPVLDWGNVAPSQISLGATWALVLAIGAGIAGLI